ncbi:hypothetical protein M5226_004393 [Vibrio vulnificus]|nr:hypothetical protein [Vibrio vulnificus]
MLNNVVGEKIVTLLDGYQHQGSLKDNFALMNHYVVFDTQRAIFDLLALRHIGAAKALLRVLFEAHVRGKWLYKCASEKQIAQAQKDNIKSKTTGNSIQFYEMIEDLEKASPNLNGALKKFKDNHWKGLNSLTHSGVLQLQRYSSLYNVENIDAEIATIIDFSNRMTIGSLSEVGVITKNKDIIQSSIELTKAL